MDRRAFIRNTCLGTAGLLLERMDASSRGDLAMPKPPPILVHGMAAPRTSPLGMPGLFPGKVVQVHDLEAIVNNHVSEPVVRRMLEQGMKELTGEKRARDAWATFISPTDVVGIKINPSGAPACSSSPELVREIIIALEAAGVPSHNIVVWDRYSYEMDIASCRTTLPPGVRVVGIENGVRDISGYDLNVYCQANFFGEWETRSYMASVVTQGVNKIINVPTTKDHSAAGVTGCLKNLGYGSFNNVARSHRPPYSFTDPLIGTMCSVEPLRSKAVLHIMDGMRQVWHGGPLTQVQDFIEQAGTLYIGTDPVALDTFELQAIEATRKAKGAPSLLDHDPASITSNNEEFFHNPSKNLFYRRPGHIAAAGKLGLGVADLHRIDHRRIELA